MKLTRVLIPLAATALLLTGCSAGGGPAKDASGESCLVSGDASKTIEVKGEVGTDLELTSKTPVSAKKTERSVLKEGEGDLPKAGQSIEISMSMFSGADGTNIQHAPTSPIPNVKDQLAPWAYDGVRCATPGQQTAIVAPYADVFGENPADQLGVEGFTEKDSVVIVMEFGEVTAGEPEACEKFTPRDEKFPEVDLGDGSAEPKITIPECMEPPTELEVTVLDEGDGAVVNDGDAVMTNYVGVDWNGAVVFESNWSEAGIPFDTNGVIEGFKQAMVGQKLGSTILATIPSELGYKDGMTRTFVLELVSLAE